jgi:hypothetical protein
MPAVEFLAGLNGRDRAGGGALADPTAFAVQERNPRLTMWFVMRKEDLSFAQRAPVVHLSEAVVPQPRALVFAAFAEPRSWKHWFPNVRDASYSGAAPYGVGTIREAHVGGTYWREEMIAWNEGTHLAWTVTDASVPFAKAQVESFEFMDAPSGTCVRWTLSLEPRLLARLGAPFARPVINRLLRRALRSLAVHLQSNAAEPTDHARRYR